VHGLEQNYQDQVEFRSIDANTPLGKAAYHSYILRGHPAFVLLNPQGEVLWSGYGEQSRTSLEQKILMAIKAP
jgi:hypothetical protein